MMRLRVSWASSLVRRAIVSRLPGHGVDIHPCLYVNYLPFPPPCQRRRRSRGPQSPAQEQQGIPMPILDARLARAAFLIASLALLAACVPKGPPGGPGGGMPPALVAVKEVQPATVAVEYEFPAQAAGSREAEVRSRVGGLLIRRNYEEGASVRAGQSLFTIDSAPYDAAAASAEADVAAAEARLANATRTAKRL